MDCKENKWIKPFNLRYPDCIKLDRIDDIKHWFTESAREANKELGEKMVELSLKHLNNTIR